jgi:hypothetical protein
MRVVYGELNEKKNWLSRVDRHLGDCLGFTKMEDWYRVTMEDFNQNNGTVN